MLAAPVYRRTRPYSEKEIYPALMAFLENRFIFRKLEIDQWLGDDRIIFIRRDEDILDQLNSGKSAEELWEEGLFEDWATYSPMTVKNMCGEFLFKNALTIPKGRKTLIKAMLKAEVEIGSVTTTIKFNPLLKTLINNGRQRVTGVKPLPYYSSKRAPVELRAGDTCYICPSGKAPYMADPAYVYRKSGGSYLIIFFSNRAKGKTTSQTNINMGRFISAPADELGLTPEQAVAQYFC